MNLNSRELVSAETGLSAHSKAIGKTSVLLIGANGFIGSRILQALRLRTGIDLSILARRPDAIPVLSRANVLRGDITDPGSLRRAAHGTDVVINAASYVGPDADMAWAINFEGTLQVIDACRHAGTERLLHLSTAAIYGSGPHQGDHPGKAAIQPESAVSRSRAAADQAVLVAGGITIRPNLVHGTGDRWFIPGLVRMFTTLGATINDGLPLLSLIDVETLGSFIADVALGDQSPTRAIHPPHAAPVPLASLLEEVRESIAPLRLHGSVQLQEAVRRLRPAGFRAHQISMLGADNYYHDVPASNVTASAAGTFRLGEDSVAWYRQYLHSPPKY